MRACNAGRVSGIAVESRYMLELKVAFSVQWSWCYVNRKFIILHVKICAQPLIIIINDKLHEIILIRFNMCNKQEKESNVTDDIISSFNDVWSTNSYMQNANMQII